MPDDFPEAKYPHPEYAEETPTPCWALEEWRKTKDYREALEQSRTHAWECDFGRLAFDDMSREDLLVAAVLTQRYSDQSRMEHQRLLNFMRDAAERFET